MHSNFVFCMIHFIKSGPGQVEEPEEEYFPGSHQKRGGEEDDGTAAVRRHLHLCKEKKH